MLKFILFLNLIAFCAFSQQPKNDLVAAAKQKFDWINKHNLENLVKLYADSTTSESPNFEGIKKGKAGISEVYGRYFKTFPDLHYEITKIISTDSAVVVEYIATGTLTNNEAGVPDYMKGKKHTLKSCVLMDIQNGKIIKEVAYFDQVAFLRQMGFFEQKN